MEKIKENFKISNTKNPLKKHKHNSLFIFNVLTVNLRNNNWIQSIIIQFETKEFQKFQNSKFKTYAIATLAKITFTFDWR